jgi:glycosyltransferase involved in cell wall biosynthesis
MLKLGRREWGHKHVYNEEELVRIAQMAGLDPTRRCEHGKSDAPEFVGRETRNSSKLIMEFTVPDRTVSAQPLVSVLTPAFRSTWFKLALQSALSQTYSNIEIIICDDSPNEEIAQIAKEAAEIDPRVHYFRNDPPKGCHGNFLKCYELARGEFIKYLNDDDLLSPICIEKMLDAFREYPSVTLVTSYRKRIDESGKELSDIPSTRKLSKTDCEIDGVSCASALIQHQINFIGEPTTTMFRKSDLTWVKPHLLAFGGMQTTGAGDAAMWLNLLGRGNAYYIAEQLSSFRIHAGQRQKELPIQIAGLQTWKGFIFHGRRLGLLKESFSLSVRARGKRSQPWSNLYIAGPISYLRLVKRLIKTAMAKLVFNRVT